MAAGFLTHACGGSGRKQKRLVCFGLVALLATVVRLDGAGMAIPPEIENAVSFSFGWLKAGGFDTPAIYMWPMRATTR